MIIELLLIIIILWIITRNFKTKGTPISKKLNEVNSYLQKICEKCKINPYYQLVNSDDSTYTENKSIIHLVIVNPETQEFYDDQTIIHAAIHELTHIICPDLNHTLLFNSMEEYFNGVAISSGILDKHLITDESYPCVD